MPRELDQALFARMYAEQIKEMFADTQAVTDVEQERIEAIQRATLERRRTDPPPPPTDA